MESSRNPLSTLDHRGLHTSIAASTNPLLLQGLESPGWKPGSPWAVPLPAAHKNSRCIEKGCVFPAAYEGRCLQHERQAREPILFSSHQPTHVVLDQGRFGLREDEIDTSKFKDRRKLAALRERFLED